MKQIKPLLIVLAVVMGLCQVGPLPPTAAQDSYHGIYVYETDASQFPSIRVGLVARQNGVTVKGLNADSFNLSDVPNNLVVTSTNDLPTTTAVVIDLSADAVGELNAAKDAAYAFVNDTFQEGDRIIFYLVNTAGTISPREATTKEDAIAIIQGMLNSSSQSSLSISTALQSAVTSLQNVQRNEPSQQTQILVIAAFLSGQTQSLISAQNAATAQIPVHVVHAFTSSQRDQFSTVLQALANAGGGQFVVNDNYRYTSGNGSLSSAGGELAALYGLINDGHIRYQLEYDATLQDTSPSRTVTIMAQGLSGSFSYNPEFQAPVIELVDTDVTVSRTFNDANELDTPDTQLSIRVNFPDGVERSLDSVQLTIKNTETGQLQETINAYSTNSDGSLGFTWPLTTYIEPEKDYQLELEFRVIDELGLSDTESLPASVTVGAIMDLPTYTPPPTPTLRPTFTPQFTFTPQATPLPTDRPVSVLSTITGDESAPSQDFDTYLFFGMVAIIFLLFSTVIFLWRTKMGQRIRERTVTALKQTDVYKRATELFTRGPSAVDPSGGSGLNPVLAQLRVNKGADVPTIMINRPIFIVGRDLGEGAHYALKTSQVSTKHFTIRYEQGQFTIMDDLKVTNATYVDGVPLTPNQPRPLAHGSHITIGNQVHLEMLIENNIGTPTDVVHQQAAQFGWQAPPQQQTSTDVLHSNLNNQQTNAIPTASLQFGNFGTVPESPAGSNGHEEEDDYFSDRRLPARPAGERDGEFGWGFDDNSTTVDDDWSENY